MRLTKAQRASVHAKFGGRCAYCGCELCARWHADHLLPVERKLELRGGRLLSTGELHKPENDRLDNFMPACAPCNLSKHSMPLEGWRQWLAGHVNSLNQYHPIYRLARAYGLIAETGAPVTFYFERHGAENAA
ncbi:HNH endonuclease signature motif containing protein [Massilia sp.]|uniref:HNH endonuclease n=1 Tax=Massilia sp. TaxID=1882437 RepID=UPI00289BDA7C|nr:HNH endonuclease signature motif containing protein [Massilia sp.]